MTRDAPRWLVTMLLCTASLLGLGGLTLIIDFDSWLSTVVVIVAAVALVIVVVRTRSRSPWIPTAAGAVAALMFLLWAYALRPDGSHHLLPTPGGLTDLGAALSQGVHHANVSVIPVTATPGFAALICASVVALFLVVEHLAVSWGLTATAGIVLVLPWLPAAILQHSVSIGLLLAVIACWVAAMVITRRRSSRERAQGVVGAALAAGVVVCLALLVAPLAVGAPGWGIFPRFDSPFAIGGATRLNLSLDLRQSLTTRSTNTVMVYASSGAAPDTLRLYTLSDFDGHSWARAAPSTVSVPATDGVLWPTAVDDWAGRTRERLDIQIRSLAEANLPLPSAPRTVDIGPSWEYFPTRDEVTSQTQSTKDLTYSVVTDLGYHDQESLVAAQAAIDDDADAAVDARYLAIAPAIDLERMRTVAQDVTAQASSRYDQALALQQYLRDPMNFRYDTTVTPNGSDSISEFLDSGEGFCVQFASTMVVLARALGIPARLAVGFLGGEATPDSTYVVRGSDAHAWPELYFADSGWVRFEPTPAVQTGAAPAYAVPATTPTVPSGIVPGNRAPIPRDEVTSPAVNRPSSGEEQRGYTPTVGWWAGAGILVMALGAALVVWWRRRTRSSQPTTAAEQAWRLLANRLAPSIGWPDTLTPLEADQYVAVALSARHATLSDDSRAALLRITTAVSQQRYGPSDLNRIPAPAPHEGLVGDAKAVATEVVRLAKSKPPAGNS